MNAQTTRTALTLLALVAPLLACRALKQDSTADEPSSNKTASETTTAQAKPAEEGSPSVDLDKVYALGEKVELDGLTMWVDSWRECKKSSKRWMGALAYYEGTLPEGNADVDSVKWKAYDDEGIAYDRHGGVTFGDCKPVLSTSRVAKGDKTKGWVYFGIPEGAKGLTAKYTHRPPRRKGQPQAPDQVVTFKLE